MLHPSEFHVLLSTLHSAEQKQRYVVQLLKCEMFAADA